MPLHRFIPHQAWTAQTTATPPPPPSTVGSTTKLHFNRLLDASDPSVPPPHQPMEVSRASQFQHKAHEADALAEQYQKQNQSLRQQLEKAKLVHSHLHTLLLHRMQHRADICSVTLRELCAEKMISRTRTEYVSPSLALRTATPIK